MVNPEKQAPDVFRYNDPVAWLRDVVAYKTEDGRLSFRALSKHLGFGAPNYLQLLLKQERRFTVDAARRIGKGFKLDRYRTKYLECMARLALKPDLRRQEVLLEEMKKLIEASGRASYKDPGIHSKWLHAIVFELVNISNYELTVANVARSLRGIATKAEIEESIDFLIKRGFVEETASPGIFRQRSIEFVPINDVRQIDLQRNHMRYLELAKHKINEELEKREFQGLTIAVPTRRIPEAKKMLRDFFAEFRKEFGNYKDNDTVIRLQAALFHLTDDSRD
jgi:uncharacterized protein (TIGR02147 family)